MGKEQNAEYYDSIYGRSEEYKKHYSKSRYLNLWRKVLENLDLTKPILDIGCGPGQLAEMLRDNGVKQYAGIDFSQEAINNAPKAYGFDFICGDIFKIDYSPFGFHQLIICETLEHIEKDLELIGKISNFLRGNRFVFTVPTFNDAGHVRYFVSEEEVKGRFKDKVTIRYCERVGPWIIVAGIL